MVKRWCQLIVFLQIQTAAQTREGLRVWVAKGGRQLTISRIFAVGEEVRWLMAMRTRPGGGVEARSGGGGVCVGREGGGREDVAV